MTDAALARWFQPSEEIRSHLRSCSSIPSQMRDAADLARAHPDTLIILNHAGMPVDRDEAGLASMARRAWCCLHRPQCRCQNIRTWHGRLELDRRTRSGRSCCTRSTAFGVSRAMFASNFPVDKLYSSFRCALRRFRKHSRAISPKPRRTDCFIQRARILPALRLAGMRLYGRRPAAACEHR